MAIINSVVYTLPVAGDVINAAAQVVVKGDFTVQYTYSDAGVYESSTITASNLTTTGSASALLVNTFNEVSGSFDALGIKDGWNPATGFEGDHIGASVSFNATTGQLDVKFQELQGSTNRPVNYPDIADYNQLAFTFKDSAAINAKDEDLFTRTRELTIDDLSYSYGRSDNNPGDFTFADSGGTDDTITAACYTKGTLITTANGQVAIEDLAVGDQVMTVSGTLEPIIWLGNSTIHCERQLNKDKAYPVRIAKDTFGTNLPQRDLFVSPDHSLYLDGVMIPAYCLINGSTITQDKTETLVTYYHVELPKHNTILAEGLPAESYLETSEANRNFFKAGTASNATTNVTKLDVQYPACPEGTPAWQHIWDTQGYAKLTQSGPILEAVKAKLVGRAKELSVTEERKAA
jgi:Hint domain